MGAGAGGQRLRERLQEATAGSDWQLLGWGRGWTATAGATAGAALPGATGNCGGGGGDCRKQATTNRGGEDGGGERLPQGGVCGEQLEIAGVVATAGATAGTTRWSRSRLGVAKSRHTPY
jgi:hypothetical protein